ncbi:hypothetical protein [Sphingomonas sp. dw_22]|uniref:hypothetical protein n=1 Tax=Sphingomonas sp. dw_22 TaxID=2721175 RepID=UPI001BD22B00|nr:hypothetical protein [Sphingomonas sp. dw_22]
MIRLAVPAILLVAGLTGADAARQRPDPAMAKIEKRLSGLTAGAPMRCLRRDLTTSIVTADGVILYVAGRNRVYRNDVVGHCNGLARGDILVTRSFGGDVCEGDIVQTRSPTGGMFTGSCALGKFVPYTKAK